MARPCNSIAFSRSLHRQFAIRVNHLSDVRKAPTSLHVTPDVPSPLVQLPITRNQVSVMPHPLSKLRFIQYAVPQNETRQERELRLRRIELQEWNHRYWTNINQQFIEEKEEFIEKVLKPSPDTEYSSSQSYEELAVFYKQFLDSRHEQHIKYNFEWYRRNISLLWPSLVVQFIRLKRRFTCSQKAN